MIKKGKLFYFIFTIFTIVIHTPFVSSQVVRVGSSEGIVKKELVLPRCFDAFANCTERKAAGECERQDTASEMLIYCPISCDSCLPTSRLECVNRGPDISCDLGRLLDMCIRGPIYHLRRCARSCSAYIEVCADRFKPLEDVPCTRGRSLSDREFECGLGGDSVPRRRKRRQSPCESTPILFTDGGIENFQRRRRRNIIGASNVGTERQGSSPRKSAKSSRQIDITDLLTPIPPVQPDPVLTTTPIPCTERLFEEEDLVRTSVVLGSSAVILGLSYLATFSSDFAASNVQPPQPQIPNPPVNPPANIPNPPPNPVANQAVNIGFQDVAIVAPTLSVSIVQPIVAAAAAAVASTIAVSAATVAVLDRRPKNSFELGRAEEFVFPTPDISRSLVPNCDIEGYRNIRRRLFELLRVDNGLPVPTEGLDILRQLRFCRYGGSSIPAELQPITFESTPTEIVPPDGFLGISTPTITNNFPDINQQRKKRSATADKVNDYSHDRTIHISLDSGIGVITKHQMKSSSESDAKFDSSGQKESREKRGITDLFKSFTNKVKNYFNSDDQTKIDRRADRRKITRYGDNNQYRNLHPIEHHPQTFGPKPYNPNVVENHHINSLHHNFKPVYNHQFREPSINHQPSRPGFEDTINFSDFNQQLFGNQLQDIQSFMPPNPELLFLLEELNNLTKILTENQNVTIPERPSLVQVPVEPQERYFCGGALITDRHLLTAAHCIDVPVPNAILLGSKGNERRFAIADIYIHHDYVEEFNEHDIAILVLNETLKQSDILRPYCTPKFRDELENKTCIASGWGTRPNMRASEVLVNTTVIVRNREECNQNYSRMGVLFTDEYPNGITENMLCANGDMGEDTCKGDSGGPLLFERDGIQETVGIISAGLGCRSREFPGIYSRVDAYMDWIDFVIYGKCASSRFGSDNSTIT